MPRSPTVVDRNAASTSIESALGVKGQLRVRSYGNVKHAHVILRKVDEEEYEDNQGHKRMRGVFSLFAHKLINVKPGKELFMYLHPVGKDLQDRVVAFEADIFRGDETDVDMGDSAKSDETLVQREQALPPKLRKLWARKPSMPAKQDDIMPTKASVGVQVQPSTASAQVQAQPSSSSIEIQAQPSLTSVDIQVRPSSSSIEIQAQPSCSSIRVQARPLSSSVEIQASTRLTSFGTQTRTTPESDAVTQTLDERLYHSHINVESHSPPPLSAYHASSPVVFPGPEILDLTTSSTNSSVDLHQRSLSPMELESAPPSPAYSPELLVIDLPSDESESKSQTRVELRETEDELQPASAVALVESPHPLRERPVNVSNNQEPHAKSYHAPKFVPAQYNPFAEQKPSAMPSTSKVTLDLVQTRAVLTNARHTPTTPAALSMPVSRTVPVAPAALRVGMRPAPTFVPATRLSQAPPSQPQPEPAPPLPTSTAKKARKRALSPIRASTLVEQPANKKWKPIVKLEPLSPVLSSIQPQPEHDGSDGPYGPPLPPPVLSSAPAAVYNPLAGWFESIAVKAEHLDDISLSEPLSVSRTTNKSIPESAHIPEGIDLTLSRQQRTRIDLTLPPRPSRALQRNGGASSNMGLPVLRRAQIKMGGSGRESGVRGIVFNPTGKLFAVVCRDNTVRIWDNSTCTEIAKLAHSASVMSVIWLEGDTSVASLGSNGIVSKWTMLGENRWEWAKLVDSGDADPVCLAYHHNKLAVANPRKGIKIWELENDRWRALERNVPRKDVVTIKFINDGCDLLCGSSDGTVFRCTVPKCRVQPVTTFKTKAFHVDADPTNRYALIAQACGRAHLIELTPTSDERDVGRIVQDYSLRDAEQRYSARAHHAFGAIFANQGDVVIFGSIGGRVLVWDKKRGRIKHEMDHGSDVLVQAVASFDGKKGERYLVSSTRQGKLIWWDLSDGDTTC